MQTYHSDCIIFGGGVAGVWVNALLKESGYSTYLLEKKKIGGEQTLSSQGIIHKGMKYLLGVSTPKIAKLLVKSTNVWEAAFKGHSLVDLSQTEIYTHKQLIWGEKSLLTSFFVQGAQQIFQSQIKKIAPKDIPKWLTYQPKNIFWLQEKVINSHSMMQNFYHHYKNQYYQYSLEEQKFFFEKKNHLIGIKLPQANIVLWTKKIILAAGKGNKTLAELFKIPYQTQIRPLTMIMVEHDNLFPIYGHCITTSTKPLFTISSHKKENGKILWYLGGKIAENNNRVKTNFIQAKQLLQKNIKINLAKAKWNYLQVDRAEPYQKNGTLPEQPFIQDYDGVIVCSPVKLAFAPLVAVQVKNILSSENISANNEKTKELPFLKAKLANSFLLPK